MEAAKPLFCSTVDARMPEQGVARMEASCPASISLGGKDHIQEKYGRIEDRQVQQQWACRDQSLAKSV